MRVLAALAAGAVAWACATAAGAEPANTAGLKLLGATPKGPIFLADGPGKRTGSVVEFWTLTAFKGAEQMNGMPVLAAWASQRIDCTARTMTSGESVVLNDRLAVVLRQPSTVGPRPIVAGSAGDKLRAHYCDGAPLTGITSTPVAGVTEAVRLAKTPGVPPPRS